MLFVPGWDATYAILVQADGLAISRLEPVRKIVPKIAALVDPETLALPSEARAAGRELYDLLLAPLAAKLRGKDLVIVPGGALAHLPFELLVEGDRFLIETHRVRYAPSLTALHLGRLWQATRKQPTRPLWAMGDPVYAPSDERVRGKADLGQASRAALEEYVSRMRGAGPVAYARLPFSGRELAAIRDLLGAGPTTCWKAWRRPRRRSRWPRARGDWPAAATSTSRRTASSAWMTAASRAWC